MRLWSVHPRYLDRQGLTACWREGLLAQAVLLGRTRGYRQHPQLVRFRSQADPAAAVGAYLLAVAAEAAERGYRFDLARVERADPEAAAVQPRIPVTAGQVAHEWEHLTAKLQARSPDQATALVGVMPEVHPLFVVVPGGVEAWERL
jgi:hypothetical protein